MTTDQAKAYVDTRVKNLADSKIKPLMDSIADELQLQRCNGEKIKALEQANTDSNARIAEKQKLMGVANTEVNQFAEALAASAAEAVS
jgi:Glu-tRNA(Gln) amidotransferase subunit E-like FAD-binding protein